MEPDHIRNSNHSTVGTELTTAERRRAVRSVAGAARDVQDCAMLLAALGLEPEEGRTPVAEPELS